LPGPPVVGRGGLKLEAAIERFRLDGRVRGAACLDVGASTGGFTEALLRHGARRVTAIDVGRGQLHPSLRDDARVENLEGVHFKTMPLTEAAGPYDFFSVDVSFVAARTMLRGLAFRLRDGAEGVVLIKPQFELPESQVKGGDVSDPNLRRSAVERVREKAESLGFELVEHADSPVEGGSGTVEILAHLRFRGRSARLPKPGERRPQKSRRVREPAAEPGEHVYFAVAAPGIEPVLAKEVAALEEAREVRVVPGGVEFQGPLAVCLRANLWLRTATRVLVRVGTVEAREFARLRRRASTLPWTRFLDGRTPIELHVSQARSRLYHTGAVAENLTQAIADRVGVGEAGAGEPLGVFARGQEDVWTLSVDSSGELLHRRGWREEGAQAPLRETLACAILGLCEWDPATPLYDPMCGAGTFPVEACALAMRVAPGLERRFAFERWPGFDAALWARLREEARARSLASPPAPIVGADHAARAIESARRNAERAGLAAHVTLARAELGDARPPDGQRGLVVCNPPYGRRVGDPRALRTLYGALGRLLRERFSGWRAGVLSADPRLDSAFGLRSSSVTPLQNGGLRVRLLRFDVS
jgi:TlyA family rRNA methyltransferase/putative hemolysin